MTAKRRKKWLLPAGLGLLVAGALAGGWFFLGNSAEPVNVYSFQNVGMTEFWGDSQESYGPVSTDKIQTEFLSTTQTVTEVAVKEGDQVKKGDILFSFDTTLDSLSLERKRLEVEKIQVQIKAAGERLEETYEMVPYNPPGITEEEEDPGEELKTAYQISEKTAYDGSTGEKYMICWLQEEVPITDGILQELYETSLTYRQENEKLPEAEDSSASAVPASQTGAPGTLAEAAPQEQSYTVPGFFFCNGEPVTADDMIVGAAGYLIRDSYTHQNKTYWLQSAVPKKEAAQLDGLKIPAYPQTQPEQADWEALWQDGITVNYIREVSMTGAQLQEGSFREVEQEGLVQLELGEEAVLMFTPQIQAPPENTTLEFSVAPSGGILQPAHEEGFLLLSGRPEELTAQPESYTVTAKYLFEDNHGQQRAVEETFSFHLSVVETPRVQKGEFYVVFKTTEVNFQCNPQTMWEGAHVFVYEDGSFGLIPFEAAGLEDHMLPPPEEIDIDLPVIDPNAIYTGEEILEMQKQLNETIKEQKEKLKLAEAEYNIMERELGDGNVYAQIDGKVVSLLSEEEARENKQPMIKVSGGGGFYISGSVSELEKESLKIGQEVTVNDWNTGSTYTGEVVSIGDFPSNEDNWNGIGNPTASYYPFQAFVSEEADLQAGSYVSMTYSSASAERGIYLEKPFIRTDQDGSYIYVRGDDGRLERKPVKLGKLIWGSYYEILSDLTEEDWLAFPYGKMVREGAPTVESEISALYGY